MDNLKWIVNIVCDNCGEHTTFKVEESKQKERIKCPLCGSRSYSGNGATLDDTDNWTEL